MASRKPTFVMFPGAFHKALTMAIFAEKLGKEGYDVETETLTAVGNPEANITTDVTLMHQIFQRLFQEDKDVILVVHSYAGFPGSIAVKGQARSQRAAKGYKGGILGAIWIASFIPKEGVSLYEMIGGNWQWWMSENAEKGLIEVNDPIKAFYGNVEESLAKEMAAELEGHSIQAFKQQVKIGQTGVGDSAFDGRRGYVYCEDDGALPDPTVQDFFMENSTCGKDGWIVERIPGDHSPFLARPSELVTKVVKLANLFAQAS